ncbi:MAG: hypothetical protein CVU59_03395 [Deltaproteobacteria bacterium HGW-Deltaproteobacteria-17]|nr:MAG: hypothetical protein CVU59_03395 [Deltaproteobacteria bacterium HGW-Deltaproteobacteria-17]
MKLVLSSKKLLSGLLATGSTLVLAACYGVTAKDLSYFGGSVADSQNGRGIPGIEVCASQRTYSACALTDEGGWYHLDVDPGLFHADYDLCATDVDGAENGLYGAQCRTIHVDQVDPSEDFLLDRIGE